MSLIGLGLLTAGIVLFIVGYRRAREAWGRYERLREQDENANRYRAWRGGLSADPGEVTGAAVMKALLRRRAQLGMLVAALGAGLVLAGFLAR